MRCCRPLRLAPLLIVLVGCAAALPERGGAPVVETAGSARDARAVAATEGLDAAEAALNLGDLPRARRSLAEIPDGALPTADLPRLQLLQARLAAAEGRPAEVLARLPAVGSEPRFNAEVEALRAEAHQALGDPVAATQAWVDRSRWLSEADLLADNEERLWTGLMAAPLMPSDLLRAGFAGPLVEGWVALAFALQRGDGRALADWPGRFPGHPAEARRRAPGASPFALMPGVSAGGEWALLLPLSGPLQASGEAVRDGWITAQLKAGDAPPVRIYDTRGTVEGALAAYGEAVSRGARLVVGPLRREDVAAVVRAGALPVPVLALNQLAEADRGAPVIGLLQFPLAPEDEARAAAEHAASQGLLRAIALLPEGEWGSRVAAAFRERLTELGGRVVDEARYAPRNDYSEPIKRLLRVSESEARHRALSGILGTRPVFEAKRRADVDLVFLAGRPLEARQIWSQFRFHRGSDLVPYTTSLAYEPPAAPGSDLAGLRFCDARLLIDPAADPALKAASQALPSASRQPRLFALGADAFALAQRFAAGALTEPFSGASGELQVGADGVVRRRLDCARMTASGIARLTPASPPAW